MPRGVLSRPALLLVKAGNEIAIPREDDPLAEIGLSGRQYMVLAVLDGDTPPSQQELAGMCGLLPAQVVAVIDELERRGLVDHQRAESDRRRSVGQPHGRRAARRSMQADALGRSAASSELDAEAADVVVKTLSRSYNTAPLEPI